VPSILVGRAPGPRRLFNGRHQRGSPTGAPVTISDMLEFAERHKVKPQASALRLPINDALAPLYGGRARYRTVLETNA
jgi:uncharacterized zinc-type alcohol dehydrogenase-like protein